MRLEQVPKLKRAIEKNLDQIQEYGINLIQVNWSVEVLPGEVKVVVVMSPEFDAMKDPHSDDRPITKEQFAEIVSGSTKVNGSDGFEHIQKKQVLVEDE
jgi:hypothetical protein